MSAVVHGDSLLNEQEKELNQRLRRLYPAVNENETPLPRSWSPKDKFSYIGLSQNNLRVHYKGMTRRHTPHCCCQAEGKFANVSLAQRLEERSQLLKTKSARLVAQQQQGRGHLATRPAGEVFPRPESDN